MSMNPSWSFRMPALYCCSDADGDVRSRTVSTTFWKYFTVIFHSSVFSLKMLYASLGKMPHMSFGSACLNHASGESAASGPNTVNVLPDPESPYANMTTALPLSRSFLIFSPQAS